MRPVKIKIMQYRNGLVFVVLLGMIVWILSQAACFAGPGDVFTEKVRVQDSDGKTWEVSNWQEGSRPYAKDLLKREAEYRQKWGEDWAGPPYQLRKRARYGAFTMSPGTWAWEEVVVIPEGKSACPFYKKSHYHPWIKSQPLVYAPMGGEVSDIYAAARFGLYHVDPHTRKITYIGWMPPSRRMPIGKHGHAFVYDGRPPVDLGRDGMDDQAGLQPAKTSGSRWMSVDPVTGRVFFIQGTGRMHHGMLAGPYVLRYVEKLLPYVVGERRMMLPAFLDHEAMYKKVDAEPIFEGEERAPFRFAVRTTPVQAMDLASIASAPRVGTKILLSPDGKVTYLRTHRGKGDFAGVHAVDIETGKDLGAVAHPEVFPRDIERDRHAGICGRFDEWIYACKHTGSLGGPGKLFRFHPQHGTLQVLYDSTCTWEYAAKRPSGYRELQEALQTGTDGPADATTLKFETTCFQCQCPRTGAIYNGGWDAAGIRRYHDGFVTSLARTHQMGGEGGRPEWGDDPVACFGSLQSCPDVAPNGDVYLTSCQERIMFPDDPLRVDGIRIVRLYRTDWPEEQPVNGYANRFLSPEERERRMLEYARQYIANYDAIAEDLGIEHEE